MSDLETDLRNILYREDEAGVGPLAKMLVDNLPPAYAAAPELLAALAAIISCHDNRGTVYLSTIEQARAAIARAKGIRP